MSLLLLSTKSNYLGWMDQGDHSWYQTILLLKVRVDKLLLKHVGLPHVLVLAVHLVNFFSWVSQGGHSEQMLFCALFYQSTPSCLKVMGGAQGPNPSFFLFI